MVAKLHPNFIKFSLLILNFDPSVVTGAAATAFTRLNLTLRRTRNIVATKRSVVKGERKYKDDNY